MQMGSRNGRHLIFIHFFRILTKFFVVFLLFRTLNIRNVHCVSTIRWQRDAARLVSTVSTCPMTGKRQ